MSALTNERRQLLQRLEGVKRRTHRVMEELKVVDACNDQIRDNIESWDKQRLVAEHERIEVKKAAQRLVPGLEEKVGSLMRQLDMENGACEAAAEPEVTTNKSDPTLPDVAAAEEGGGDDDWTIGVSTGGSVKKKKPSKKKK
jgi:hypothetical protein